MKITRVAAERFRRFERVSLSPHSRLTVLHGANASGKTSLLEAAYFGARAASFRARRLSEIVQEGQAAARVALAVQEDPQSPSTQWNTAIVGGDIEIRRMDESSHRRALAQALPVVLVDRQLHRVFEEGPVYRRRYLDWGLFYVEPSFIGLWQRHERALRQRNQALRQRAPRAEIEVWNPEFVATANALHQLRMRHVTALEVIAKRWVEELLGTTAFDFHLTAGWNESVGLELALTQGEEGDRKAGFTHAGPHRAELKVRFEQREARAFVSRGQQKLLAVAMALAQAELVQDKTGRTPAILLDDLEAELSLDWQCRLLKALLQYPGQSLVTSLEWRDVLLPTGTSHDDYAVFHVEQLLEQGRAVPTAP